MALARIFTTYNEHAAVLCRQLKEQGYSVEVLKPEELPAAPADLEIQLEVCDPADVLRRAAELAEQLHADIAIAPGVLMAEAAEVAPVADPAPAVAPPELTAAPETVLNSVPDGNDPHEPATPQPAFLEPNVRKLGAQLGACVAGASDLLAFGRAEFRERVEQARIRRAEMRERRQERLLELMRHRLEARLRAVELEGVRRAAAAVLAQEDMDAPPGFVRPKAPVRAARPRIWSIRVNKREVAVAGLISAVALFVAGLAIASFRSHPDTASGHGVTVQSGGATIQGQQPKPASPARPSPVLRKEAPKPVTHQARRKQRSAPRQNRETVASDVVVRHVATPRPTPRTQANGWKHFSDTSN
jgi:hypothetical protein